MSSIDPPASPRTVSVLVVETIEEDSPAARAAVKTGDLLRTYDGQSLSSPTVLQALEENTFDKDRVALKLQRDGEQVELSLPPGKLGIGTRPQLVGKALTLYEAGRTAQLASRHEEAAERWADAAREAAGTPEIAAWLYEKAGEGWEKASGWPQASNVYSLAWKLFQEKGDTAGQATLAIALGRCSEKLNDFEAAVAWYEQAQHLDEAADRSLWVARDLTGLGIVATNRGDLKTAQDYHTRALQIKERLAPNSLDVAASLNNLGLVDWKRGDLQAAQDYHVRALQIRERLAPGSLHVAHSLGNLGIVAWQRGDLQGAQDCLIRSLQICERVAPNSLDAATSLNILGLVAIDRGDLQAAQDYHARALQIRERFSPNSLEVAYSLNNLGNVAFKRGDLQAAQDYYTRALQIKERLAPNALDVASSLNNLGIVAETRGDLQAAQDYHTRALQIKERLAPNSLDTATSLHNLGLVAIDRGDLQAAQDYHVRALQIREHLAPNSLDVAHSLNGLGRVAYRRSNLPVAQDYHTRALQIQERLAPTSLNCSDTLTLLGQTLLRQQRPAQALPLLQQAVQILEQQRSAITSPDARALLLAQHTTQFAALIQGYLALHQPEAAFATLERSRARSLLELVSERRLDFTTQASPQLLNQQRELDHNRAHLYDQLAKLSATVEDDAHIEALHQQLRDLERQQHELTAQIRQSSPRYAALQYPQPLDCPQVQALLEVGTLLLSYLVDEEQTFLFALTNTTLDVFTLPLGRKELAQQVEAFRTALDVRLLKYHPGQATQQGKALYDRLLAPAQVRIKASRRLLLCPGGPLHALPFAALVVKEGRTPRYLGQEKLLHTTLSMTVCAQTREGSVKRFALSVENLTEEAIGREGEEKQAARTPFGTTAVPCLTSSVLQTARRVLALGDPLYVRPTRGPQLATPSRGSRSRKQSSLPQGDPELAGMRGRGLTLTPLPHSREEVEGIGRLFGEQARVRLGAEATKTAARAECGEADIVHFACHGWLDSEMPLSSGLVLSQPEALGKRAIAGDNGLLQAWEIFGQVRLKADLVVLSACQTGLGQEVRGEGLIGLTRAFTYAGARSVLVSLWEVNDASTSAFMQGFYAALKEGKGRSEALQEATKQMSEHPQWKHPFFWSAFVLQGED